MVIKSLFVELLAITLFLSSTTSFLSGATKKLSLHSGKVIPNKIYLFPVKDEDKGTLGAPYEKPAKESGRFESKSGVVVDFSVRGVDDANLEVNKLVSALDDFKGHNSSG